MVYVKHLQSTNKHRQIVNREYNKCVKYVNAKAQNMQISPLLYLIGCEGGHRWLCGEDDFAELLERINCVRMNWQCF